MSDVFSLLKPQFRCNITFREYHQFKSVASETCDGQQILLVIFMTQEHHLCKFSTLPCHQHQRVWTITEYEYMYTLLP